MGHDEVPEGIHSLTVLNMPLHPNQSSITKSLLG